ncbi:hypothetical protein HDU92_005497 [Lobulomyces angularis]|nr:hypothetical protein HDU92_005497 [Lobulomyces angularis]
MDKNSGLHTYDGIDVLGDESVRWVENFLFDKPDVTEVSFIGYSLGGLVMRYTVGKLYHKKFFDKYTPVNFITFASPHLGASKLPNKIFNHLFNFFSGNIALRTGKQIALLDHFLNGLPLLVIMSNPNYCFFQALELFKRRALFTNVLNDRMITYTSGSISRYNPYLKHRMIVPDLNYPSIVTYDKSNLPVKLNWSRDEIKKAALFGCLPFSTLKKKYIIGFRPTDLMWVTNHLKVNGADSLFDQKILSDKRKVRLWMVKNLNKLDFMKVDVYLRFTNSHAGIVIRDLKRFKAFVDVIEYLTDKVFLMNED